LERRGGQGERARNCQAVEGGLRETIGISMQKSINYYLIDPDFK